MMRPPTRRRTLATLIATALLAALPGARPARAESLTDGARSLVQAFADEGLALLEDQSASMSDRTERFRGLLQKYFALDVISRWVLGRYWAQLDADQQATYRRLFEDLVVYGYVKRFGEYTGERLAIVRVLADSATQATVYSEIARPAGGQPVRVDWRVGGRDGTYKITDVIVANVSLSQTWRSDFASVVQQQGRPGALLDVLRERTQQLRADLGAG